MGNTLSAPALGPEVPNYAGPGKLYTLPNEERLLLLSPLQTIVRHPLVLHGVPWKTFFPGATDTSLIGTGFVVEPVVPLSAERLKKSSAALRLVLLRQAVQAGAFLAVHSLKVGSLVTKKDDPSHVLAVSTGKTDEADGLAPLLEEWMREENHPNWQPCLALEKTLRLLRSEYRELSGARLREELQQVPGALLREESVLLLLAREELFVQRACDALWKRVAALPDVWRVLRPRLEQRASRSVARALLRRAGLAALLDVEYACLLLCDSDEGLALEAARALPFVASLSEERKLECALRLAADASAGRRAAGMRLVEGRGGSGGGGGGFGAGGLRCAVVLRGLGDNEARVREQALLACARGAEDGVGRRGQARLLAAVARLLGRSEDDDERLAALDAAQELLDQLARPALREDEEEELDLVLPPFPHTDVFAREGLQPLDHEHEQQQQVAVAAAAAPPKQATAAPSPAPAHAPEKTEIDLGAPSPRSRTPTLPRLSPRVPGLALGSLATSGNSLPAAQRSPRVQQLLERQRASTVASESPRSPRGSPRGGSPRARASTVSAATTPPQGPVQAPSDVLRMSPRASEQADEDSE